MASRYASTQALSGGTRYVPLRHSAAPSAPATAGLMNWRSTLSRQRRSWSSVTLGGGGGAAARRQPQARAAISRPGATSTANCHAQPSQRPPPAAVVDVTDDILQCVPRHAGLLLLPLLPCPLLQEHGERCARAVQVAGVEVVARVPAQRPKLAPLLRGVAVGITRCMHNGNAAAST